MNLAEINWKPSDRQLRQFGLVALVALPVGGWLLGGHPHPRQWGVWESMILGGLAALGALVAVLGLVRPRALKSVFITASLAALPLGLMVGEVAVAVIYFGVFTPLAFVFRLGGRDLLQRRLDRAAASYWQAKAQPAGPESYFLQS